MKLNLNGFFCTECGASVFFVVKVWWNLLLITILTHTSCNLTLKFNYHRKLTVKKTFPTFLNINCHCLPADSLPPCYLQIILNSNYVIISSALAKELTALAIEKKNLFSMAWFAQKISFVTTLLQGHSLCWNSKPRNYKCLQLHWKKREKTWKREKEIHLLKFAKWYFSVPKSDRIMMLKFLNNYFR